MAGKAFRDQSMNTPERHGIHIHTARKIASPILLTINDKASAEPCASEWQEMGKQLLRGDPLADEVAAWLATSEGQWSVIERALNKGSEDTSSLPAPLEAFMRLTLKRPEWLDEASMNRGCDVVARSGKTGMRILRDFGLMAGYQASAISLSGRHR